MQHFGPRHVTVTDAGLDRLRAAEAAIPAHLDATFAALTPAERAQLTALLGKLLVSKPAE